MERTADIGPLTGKKDNRDSGVVTPACGSLAKILNTYLARKSACKYIRTSASYTAREDSHMHVSLGSESMLEALNNYVCLYRLLNLIIVMRGSFEHFYAHYNFNTFS